MPSKNTVVCFKEEKKRAEQHQHFPYSLRSNSIKPLDAGIELATAAVLYTHLPHKSTASAKKLNNCFVITNLENFVQVFKHK